MAFFVIGYRAEPGVCYDRIAEAVVVNPALTDRMAFQTPDVVDAAKKLDEWLSALPAVEPFTLVGFRPAAFLQSLVADCGFRFHRTRLFSATNVNTIDLLSVLNPKNTDFRSMVDTWRLDVGENWEPCRDAQADALLSYKLLERFSG